ncbi:hypothetical protein TEA_005534 [Camellia sinensis var. sinensis]|uniref:Amine oxidase domain-containing protein n=1 Tax=Camellia sinensis var. sinensis TaxID=542762 RepID=A0A4V3WQY9_CAMSN|nr:hypothetical protein TEA_005534 [Camellia sinensis var. sinensis]
MVAKKPRIVIIGAGMTGLAAANKLSTSQGSNESFKLCVVEGGTRIGGRINTSEFGGDRIEMGATWIHGIKGGHELNPSLVDSITSFFNKPLDFAQGKVSEEGLSNEEIEYCKFIAAKGFNGKLSVGSFLCHCPKMEIMRLMPLLHSKFCLQVKQHIEPIIQLLMEPISVALEKPIGFFNIIIATGTINKDEIREEEMESFSIRDNNVFADIPGEKLLDSIDFDDLFIGINDGDVLPDLEMDPEILAEFQTSTGCEESEKVEVNNSRKEEEEEEENKVSSCSSFLNQGEEIVSKRDESVADVLTP